MQIKGMGLPEYKRMESVLNEAMQEAYQEGLEGNKRDFLQECADDLNTHNAPQETRVLFQQLAEMQQANYRQGLRDRECSKSSAHGGNRDV